LYSKRCRRKLHEERWEIVRTKRKPKQRASADTSSTPEPTQKKTPFYAECAPPLGESSCLRGLCRHISLLGNFAVDFQRDLSTSWRRLWTSSSWEKCCSFCEVPKSWAGGVQRDTAEEASAEAAKELLGYGASAFYDDGFLGCVAKKCRILLASVVAAGFTEAADVTQAQRRKRLVQQGSRGAHLARITAARRGVRICKWSFVRQLRAAHRWAHVSTLGSNVSFAFSLAAVVYKGARSMAFGFADFARGLWNSELHSRGTSTGDLWSPATEMRGRRDAYQFARLVSLTVELIHLHTHMLL